MDEKSFLTQLLNEVPSTFFPLLPFLSNRQKNHKRKRDEEKPFQFNGFAS
jgi:hypothetical protein